MTVRRIAATLVLSLVVGACTGPILARPAPPTPAAPAATATPVPPDDPQPIVFPRDDGPHGRLTEWWYYTGHLTDADGGAWGFEYVIFRAERGGFPVSWASHLALTDETSGTFHYAQRSAIGPQSDRSPVGPDGEPLGFDLILAGIDPLVPETLDRQAWAMTGSDGRDRLIADAGVAETGSTSIGLTLDVTTDRPVTAHDGDGWIDFGPAGGSYYYSRTRMDARGELRVGDRRLRVEGIAWFDHQWGDFIAVGAGGWDWFAANLDDGTDVTVSIVRDEIRRPVLVYATVVDPDGTARHIEGAGVEVNELATWLSPRTGATYPAGWRVSIETEDLEFEMRPTVADQELDTRSTTGVIYWEGSQHVTGTHDGKTVDGRGYVELTGYVR